MIELVTDTGTVAVYQRPVRVPGPLVRHDPPHILEILPCDDGYGHPKSWELHHPEECPLACWWWPGIRTEMFSALKDELAAAFVEGRQTNRVSVLGQSSGVHTCFFQYEVEHNGIDSLETWGWTGGPDLRDDIARKFDSDRWMLLPVGRYLIEGWTSHDSYSGEYDSGIQILDRLPIRPMMVLTV